MIQVSILIGVTISDKKREDTHEEETVASENEREKVRRWLQGQGYPLEMWVARSFQEADYRVWQSEYYLDEDSKKMREIDVIARLEFPDQVEGKGICVTLVVECKVAPKPWVVFLGSQEGYPLSIFSALANRAGVNLLSNQKELTDLPSDGLICGPSYVAYAATVAFKDRENGQDQAYRACMTVGKAAKNYCRKEPLSGAAEWATLTVPIIVVDGSLFAARLEDSGNLEVHAVDRARLALKNPDMGAPTAIIDVITRTHLPGFIESVREEFQGIMVACRARPELLNERFIPYRQW